jgi:hypothetical protein
MPQRVELPRLGERSRVHVEIRVDARAGIVERSNPCEVHLDQLFGRDQLRLQRVLQLLHRGFDEIEPCGPGAALLLRLQGQREQHAGDGADCDERDERSLHVGVSR